MLLLSLRGIESCFQEPRGAPIPNPIQTQAIPETATREAVDICGRGGWGRCLGKVWDGFLFDSSHHQQLEIAHTPTH